jgi:hypothetical protein
MNSFQRFSNLINVHSVYTLISTSSVFFKPIKKLTFRVKTRKELFLLFSLSVMFYQSSGLVGWVVVEPILSNLAQYFVTWEPTLTSQRRRRVSRVATLQSKIGTNLLRVNDVARDNKATATDLGTSVARDEEYGWSPSTLQRNDQLSDELLRVNDATLLELTPSYPASLQLTQPDSPHTIERQTQPLPPLHRLFVLKDLEDDFSSFVTTLSSPTQFQLLGCGAMSSNVRQTNQPRQGHGGEIRFSNLSFLTDQDMTFEAGPLGRMVGAKRQTFVPRYGVSESAALMKLCSLHDGNQMGNPTATSDDIGSYRHEHRMRKQPAHPSLQSIELRVGWEPRWGTQLARHLWSNQRRRHCAAHSIANAEVEHISLFWQNFLHVSINAFMESMRFKRLEKEINHRNPSMLRSTRKLSSSPFKRNIVNIKQFKSDNKLFGLNSSFKNDYQVLYKKNYFYFNLNCFSKDLFHRITKKNQLILTSPEYGQHVECKLDQSARKSRDTLITDSAVQKASDVMPFAMGNQPTMRRWEPTRLPLDRISVDAVQLPIDAVSDVARWEEFTSPKDASVLHNVATHGNASAMLVPISGSKFSSDHTHAANEHLSLRSTSEQSRNDASDGRLLARRPTQQILPSFYEHENGTKDLKDHINYVYSYEKELTEENFFKRFGLNKPVEQLGIPRGYYFPIPVKPDCILDFTEAALKVSFYTKPGLILHNSWASTQRRTDATKMGTNASDNVEAEQRRREHRNSTPTKAAKTDPTFLMTATQTTLSNQFVPLKNYKVYVDRKDYITQRRRCSPLPEVHADSHRRSSHVSSTDVASQRASNPDPTTDLDGYFVAQHVNQLIVGGDKENDARCTTMQSKASIVRSTQRLPHRKSSLPQQGIEHLASWDGVKSIDVVATELYQNKIGCVAQCGATNASPIAKTIYILFGLGLLFYTYSFLFLVKTEFYKIYNNIFFATSPFYVTKIKRLKPMKYFFNFNSVLNQPFQQIFDDFTRSKGELWAYYLFVYLSIGFITIMSWFQNWFAMFAFQLLFSFYPFLMDAKQLLAKNTMQSNARPFLSRS